MAWTRVENDTSEVENAAQEALNNNRLYKLLEMIKADPDGRQYLDTVKARNRQMMTPVQQSPEELGREIQKRYDLGIKLKDLSMPSSVIEANQKLMAPQRSQSPEELGEEMIKQSPLIQLMRGSGQQKANAFRPNPAIERQIQSEASGLMADEAKAKAWHPPMAMPNTPRDPDKEAREAAAMKAFLANGGGPAFGMKPKGPMSSIVPSQNPFSQQTASPEEQARAAAGVMKSQIPQTAPVQNVQGGIPSPSFPMPEGYPQSAMGMETELEPEAVRSPMGPSNLGQSAESAPMDPMRQKLMELLEADQSPDGMMEARARRNQLDDRMNAVSQQNADLGFMKLLMQNANQMGQIDGKVASSKPFNEAVDTMQNRNSQAEQRYISSEKDAKSQRDDRMKTMLALLKMDQDKLLGRERLNIQREGMANDTANRDAILNATLGRDANSYNLGNRRLELDADKSDKTYGLQQKNIESQIKLREEQLKIAKAKADLDAAKAAKNGDHLPLGMKDRILTLSTKQANRTSMLNKMKESLKELQRLQDPKAKFDYAKSMLKMVNSPENPDAVGKEESERIGANLDNFRFQDIFVGANPVGKNFDAFESMIQSQINAMEGNYKADQREIDAINRQYPAPQGVANPDLANPGPAPGKRRAIDNFDDL